MPILDSLKYKYGPIQGYPKLSTPPVTDTMYGKSQFSINYNDLFNKNDENTPLGGQGGMPWQTIATIAAGNVLGAIDGLGPQYKSEELLRDAGTGYSTNMGVGYQFQNAVNKDEVMNEYDSNNFKKIFTGNVGGFLTGALFGRGKQQKEIEKANLQAFRSNQHNSNIAASTAMRQDFATKLGNPESQYLFAANGLDQDNGGTWAYVDPLEAGSDAEGNAYSFINKGGVPGKDSVKMFIPSDYTVHTRMNGHAQTANKEAMVQEYLKSKAAANKGDNKEIAEKVIQKELAESKQRVQFDQAKQKQERNMGLLPEEGVAHAAAGMDNWLAGLMNVGIGLGQYFGARGQKVKSPTTYFGNPYQTRALAQLDSIRSNPYPIMRQMREAEARGRYQIAQSGGLSEAQKYLANVAMTANTQNNIANSLAALQQQDNAYKAQAAQAALQVGAQTAQNRMQSNQWDLDYYSKAHAARQQGMQMGLYNVSNAVQQFLANQNKLNMFDKMYSLYSDENEINKKKAGIKSKYDV